jgi:DNA-binding transcriptional LysR family regulator
MKIAHSLRKNRTSVQKTPGTLLEKAPETHPDQWVALAAVVDLGGYARAAEVLERSQSAVSYQITQLQKALRCKLLEVQGRRAVLTARGAALLPRARGLLAEWRALETFAHSLERGFEAVLKVVVDSAFPRSRLLAALLELRRRCPSTQLDLSEAVLSGAEDAILKGALDGSADVVVTTRVPPGFLGDWLWETTFIACTSPSHPLQRLERAVSLHDLEPYSQVVVRDSGTRAPRDEGYLGSTLRWTVGSLDASRAVVESGLAYAWLPEHLIGDALAAGRLKALPLEAGAIRKLPLYLVLVRPSEAGPAARAAVGLLHQSALGDGGELADGRQTPGVSPTGTPSIE